MMAGRHHRASGTPGLFEILQESDLSQFYNELRSSLRVCHVQQLKDVTEDDLVSIGMTKSEAQKLKSLHNKYCPPGYVTKLKKLFLPTWSGGKDEFLLDDESNSETVPSPPSTTAHVSMPLPVTANLSMDAIVHHQGMEIKVPRQHLISPESILSNKILGNGEFGVVQQGVWIDQDKITRQVAIKSLSKERMQNSTVEFMKEYEIMQTIRHDNIVSLFGVVLESSSIQIITELAPLRSLLECLKEESLRKTLTVSCLALFTRQICSGMKYLESRRLIHRDLAARNILVFSQSLVKISDFGLSRALGVGKDYYQTNFTFSLKLPIAWCAPECINYLKFTSASDVWAFGVTIWEMFSYGFQPWAAYSGQQILEAIDKPNFRRLEKPLLCPADYYNIMLRCWEHKVDLRPTFAQLCSILEEARPEQVQATVKNNADPRSGFLDFEVGSVITILDKKAANDGQFWSGVRDDKGHVGLFVPSQTVTYLGTIPKNSSFRVSNAHESGLFSLKRDQKAKRFSRDMISGPQDFQHKAHASLDINSSFGLDSSVKIRHLRADSEASDMTPLISNGVQNNGHHNAPSSTASKPVNRMGHAIGYVIREKSNNPSSFGTDHNKGNEKHEYHSISDDNEEDEFFKPLDLGPSLMDEVFNELGSPNSVKSHDELDGSINVNKKGSDTKRDQLKELVSSTLNIRRHHKKKQLATVKPIKASDEKALESAIAMANALASKSMHDIDKKSLELYHGHDHSPGRSPMTPNSPSKKFSFFFPSVSGAGSKSPKNERKSFLESKRPTTNIENGLSDNERLAYSQLVGESESLPPLTKLNTVNISQSMACFPTNWSDQHDHFLQLSPPPAFPPPSIPMTSSNGLSNDNPLPLPPRSHTLSRTSLNPPRRHVRKNPLIVPSARVSNLIRNENVTSCLYGTSVKENQQPILNRNTTDDAFEAALEENIDALDSIGVEGGEESLFPEEFQLSKIIYGISKLKV